MTGMTSAVVIGNGCAGVECIKALRESGYKGKIHLMSDSKRSVYNPMLTTYYVIGKIGFEGLFPFGSNEAVCAKYDVDLHAESPTVFLDAEQRIVANKAGLELKYDNCLVATGATPVLPPIHGINSEKVFTMRTVEDAVRLKKAMEKKPRRALVVGASMVGVKLVELFHKAGVEVCLADLANHLFPLAANAECASVLEERLRQPGIRLRFGSSIEKLEEVSGGGIRAHFKDSTEHEDADLIIMCIGVRANTGFIDRKQVSLDRGVLVNEQMQTNVLGLYAAGDVAQGRNLLSGGQQIIGLWANARYQGRTAGRNMAGRKDHFPGNILHNITHFMGMDFVGIGDVLNYDHMEKQDNGKTFMQLFWKNGLLAGANFIDRYTEAGVIKNALIKGLQQKATFSPENSSLVHQLLISKMIGEVEKK